MKTVKLHGSGKEYQIGKLVCVGRNYAEHAKELNNEIPKKPVIFIKPHSAVTFSGGKVRHPLFSNDMHHEVELILLIGTTIKNASASEAEKAIAGYGVGLDMTLRDVQNELKKKGEPWTIAKCFDNSAVLSDFISSGIYSLTLNEEISLSVNDVIKQKDTLSSMLFKPVEIVEYISSLMTLEEGDVIFTGTPAGVGKVNIGDTLKAEITNVAALECFITAE